MFPQRVAFERAKVQEDRARIRMGPPARLNVGVASLRVCLIDCFGLCSSIFVRVLPAVEFLPPI